MNTIAWLLIGAYVIACAVGAWKTRHQFARAVGAVTIAISKTLSLLLLSLIGRRGGATRRALSRSWSQLGAAIGQMLKWMFQTVTGGMAVSIRGVLWVYRKARPAAVIK
ncbi:hypothetical protein [Gordonia spumicola]|uniref:hypothetical protein n=1 Tax=Gordonia spumicola TaxID=589161 RepID=UPI00137A4B1D|nr:hypothetical protein [Gordonia spumicola]